MSASTVVRSVGLAIIERLNAAGAPLTVDRANPNEYILDGANLVPTQWKLNDGDSDQESFAVEAEYTLVIHARHTAAATDEDAVDAMLAWCFAQLCAEPTLGGTVRELSLSGATYHYDRVGDVDVAHCALAVSVKFDVRRGDLTANYNLEG